MPDDKKKPTEEKSKESESTLKRADRFIYTTKDADHIFRLGKLGTVFNDTSDKESS